MSSEASTYEWIVGGMLAVSGIVIAFSGIAAIIQSLNFSRQVDIKLDQIEEESKKEIKKIRELILVEATKVENEIKVRFAFSTLGEQEATEMAYDAVRNVCLDPTEESGPVLNFLKSKITKDNELYQYVSGALDKIKNRDDDYYKSDKDDNVIISIIKNVLFGLEKNKGR